MGNKKYWIFGVLWLGMVVGMPLGVSAQGRNFTEKVNGVEFEMVYVKGGTFRMGATEEQGSEAEGDEKPVHEVTLSDYYMGKFEVTQGLWEKVMGTTIRQQRDKANSSWSLYGVGSDYPMYYVNWDEAQEFCRKLCQLTGKTYVLPTEAQWEYAARSGRGGNTSVYVWCSGGAIAFSGSVSGSPGSGEATKYSGSDDIDEVAWYTNNSGGSTHPVGQKQPNALGLYDMSGNVWEWCSDWYGSNYYSNSPQSNPTGPATGSDRVLRGGSWRYYARLCRVSNRGCYFPDFRLNYIGFRVVLLP